jgi:hypothetical protein
MEDDPIDKFIDWYVSLEALGEYKFPFLSFKPTQQVRRVIAEFKETTNIDEQKLTKFRSALFHGGRRGDEAREYCSGLDAVILNGVRKTFLIT